jgi:hypothetical protein
MTRSTLPLALAAAALQIMAAVPAAAQDVVVITKSDCQQLVRHVPAPDMAYQAGTDAYGRPVAPADLGGGYDEMAPPEEITFPVEIDLRHFQGGPAADAESASAAVIAAGKATDAATAADSAATAAEAAAAADPGNATLAQAAAAARIEAENAKSAVTSGGKSQAATASAAAAVAASQAAPADAALAAAAAAAQSSAQSATSANADLREQFRAASRKGAFLGKPVVGMITVRGDEVLFNGKPIQTADERALSAACQTILPGTTSKPIDRR